MAYMHRRAGGGGVSGLVNMLTPVQACLQADFLTRFLCGFPGFIDCSTGVFELHDDNSLMGR